MRDYEKRAAAAAAAWRAAAPDAGRLQADVEQLIPYLGAMECLDGAQSRRLVRVVDET